MALDVDLDHVRVRPAGGGEELVAGQHRYLDRLGVVADLADLVTAVGVGVDGHPGGAGGVGQRDEVLW